MNLFVFNRGKTKQERWIMVQVSTVLTYLITFFKVIKELSHTWQLSEIEWSPNWNQIPNQQCRSCNVQQERFGPGLPRPIDFPWFSISMCSLWNDRHLLLRIFLWNWKQSVVLTQKWTRFLDFSLLDSFF